MKVGILTLPFVNNYGGILQNYAMQAAIRKCGMEPITLDVESPKTPVWIFIASWIKSFIFVLFGKKRAFPKTRVNKRSELLNDFIRSSISTTEELKNLNEDILKKYGVTAVVVGSDQVWRPKYTPDISKMFLDFVKNENTKRIAYAASFGVDGWEYTPQQTVVCSELAKKFDAISVRESSGVHLCKEYLGAKAIWTLDPTLLLSKGDYETLCCDVPIENTPFLAAYILEKTDDIKVKCKQIASERGLTIKWFTADNAASLSIREWIAMFRDASYVVTDSFHGTVFSIIFAKEFKCVCNESRGSARFESLLELYNTGKLAEMRAFSLNWLKNALES